MTDFLNQPQYMGDASNQSNTQWGQSNPSGYGQSDGQQRQSYQQNPYQRQYQSQPTRSSKSKLAAGLLGILFGFAGVHNFYIGRVRLGVVQLLITILSMGTLEPISGIWGIIEGVLILASKPGDRWHQDANGAELSD